MSRYVAAVTPFLNARRDLFLDRYEREEKAIVIALHRCYEGLKKIDTSDIGGEQFKALERIQDYIYTSGIPDYKHPQYTERRVQNFSRDKMEEVCDDIDSLGLFFEQDSVKKSS